MPIVLPKRLPLGKFIIGPDFHGCINTGTAPALLYSRVLRRWPILSRGYRFAVGPHVYVENAISALTSGLVPSGRAYHEQRRARGEIDTKRTRVRFFKTAAGAKKHFADLVAAAEAVNANVRAKEDALRRKAAKGNIGAAIELIDYL